MILTDTLIATVREEKGDEYLRVVLAMAEHAQIVKILLKHSTIEAESLEMLTKQLSEIVGNMHIVMAKAVHSDPSTMFKLATAINELALKEFTAEQPTIVHTPGHA